MSDTSYEFDDVLDRMISDINDEASKLEGSFAASNLQAVADEISRIHAEELDGFLDRAFTSTASGEDLILCGRDANVPIKEAAYAEVYVTLSGSEGSYSGIRVAADDLVFTLANFTIDDSAQATVYGICETAGLEGNVLADSIDMVLDNDYNLLIIHNDAAEGGADEEDEESYRERIENSQKRPGSSGNIYDYQNWALSVRGVCKVRVMETERGTGRLPVYIIADGYKEADADLLRRVYEYIEKKRPVGATVNITSAKAVEINVAADIEIENNVSLNAVQTEFKASITKYIQETSFKNEFEYPQDFVNEVISHIKIADFILNCTGVLDVISYEINGDTKSIRLLPEEFPVCGTISLNINQGGALNVKGGDTADSL